MNFYPLAKANESTLLKQSEIITKVLPFKLKTFQAHSFATFFADLKSTRQL